MGNVYFVSFVSLIAAILFFKILCENHYYLIQIDKEKFYMLRLLQTMAFIRCFDMNFIRRLDEVKLAPPFKKQL